ncbi:hypothetical protein M436DRAFT_78416 [Aureobasidium namibiae CBS 147.97]|uniref:FHA domain-containing protein n=1 Tax=Aureobasidium namibiae CBS 147.97 TaxID=1043004 RepID=A0A074XQ11_9PEZI
MTALFSYAKLPTRVTVSLSIISPEGASSTGPSTRNLIIPKQGSVLIGRASTSPTKDRRPAPDNALFTCPVMSRTHAKISAPDGLDGPIYLEDTGSMHGVYVNGRRITRTPIFEKDIIAFGNKVTRAEGEYLSSSQAFNFSEYPFLTPFPAIHDGVSLTVGEIVRDGAVLSNTIDLTQNAPPALCYKPVPQPSYRVPDYESDSSKENSTNTTFAKPTPVPFIDLESVSSPAPSHEDLDQSEDEDYEGLYHNGFGSESELGSDHEGHDYPEDEDDFDDDEQSYSGSDCSGSPYSAVAYEEDDTQKDEASFEVDEPLESHEDTQTAPVHVNDAELVQPKAVYPRDEDKEKTRDVAQRMSLSYFLEPAKHWDVPTMPLAPSARTPPCCGSKDPESHSLSQSKKPNIEAEVTNQDEEKDMNGQVTSADGRNIDRELEDLGLKDQTAASQARAEELLVQSSSPTGGKRKRETEDDGHEEIPAPVTERKLLRLKCNQQQMLRDFFTRGAQAAPRPTKRVKRSTARFALGAVAGAIGGVATVVGVLMTPACEELLSNWPIA